jgi:hypothetical protein
MMHDNRWDLTANTLSVATSVFYGDYDSEHNAMDLRVMVYGLIRGFETNSVSLSVDPCLTLAEIGDMLSLDNT